MFNFLERLDSPYSAHSDYGEMFVSGKLSDFPGSTWAPAGPGFVLNALLQQILHVDSSLNCEWVAGTRYKVGHVNGPGAKAQLGLGGFYETATAQAMRDDGVLIFTDDRNGYMRTLTPDGVWTVGDFAPMPGQCDCIGFDGDKFLWTFASYSGGTRKYDKTGKLLATYANSPWVYQGFNLDNQGRVVVLTKQNSATQLWDCNLVTGALTRIAGRFEDEDFGGLIDGDALKAFIFTASIVGASPDGNLIFLSGGDSENCRVFNRLTNRVGTIFPDGLVYETQELRGGQKFFIALGFDPVNQVPTMQLRFPWNIADGADGGSQFKTVQFTPGGAGGDTSMTSATFVSQNLDLAAKVFEIKMTNAGPDTWTPDSYRMGAQLPDHDSVVFAQRLELVDSVLSGGVGTFRAPVNLPAPGQYHVQYQLVRDLDPAAGGGWFGDKTPDTLLTVDASQPGGGQVGQVNGGITLQNVNVASTDTPYMLLELLDGNGVLIPGVSAQHLAPGTAAASFPNLPAPGSYKLRLTNMTGSNVPIGQAMISNLVNLASGTITVQLGAAINATGS